MSLRFSWTWAALLSVGLITSGCSSGTEEPSSKATSEAADQPGASTEEAAKSSSAEAQPQKPLLEPFTPPTLAEIDAKAQWKEMPVVDAMQLLRKHQAGEKPPVTVAEALELKNDSPENNEKIVSALGRTWTEPEQVNFDASISRHTAGEIKSTNPLFVSSAVEFDINGLTGFGLFGFDWEMNPFATAETVVSWQSSADGLYDKVVLRDDLVWSDGQPITAHDVAFTFQVIMDSRVDVPAVRSGTDKLRWVHAYDDRTVMFFHKESLSTNAWNVNFPVLPKHIYEKTREEDPTLKNSTEHVRLENQPISGGAYELTSRLRGQEVVLTRRESYYMYNGKQVREKPAFREIRFRIVEDVNTAMLAMKSGQIEVMELTPEQWVSQTVDEDFYRLNTKASGTEWVYFFFGWNMKSPLFSDKRVRQAMSYAFDYDEMLNRLFYGLYQQAASPAHPTAWFAPKTPPVLYKQDLDKAEELLDEAGWVDSDGDGVRDKMVNGQLAKFEFTILCPNIQNRIDLCALLKDSLDRIGVVCNIRPLENTVLQERTMQKEFEAFLGGWGTGTDPDTSDNLWKTGQRRNYVSFSNPEVDKLFEEGRREFDREKRAEIYGRIHDILVEEQPYTWLYYRNSFYGFNKTLRGYTFSPRGPFNYSPGFNSVWKPAAQ